MFQNWCKSYYNKSCKIKNLASGLTFAVNVNLKVSIDLGRETAVSG
jgi:hypothetical protein